MDYYKDVTDPNYTPTRCWKYGCDKTAETTVIVYCRGCDKYRCKKHACRHSIFLKTAHIA